MPQLAQSKTGKIDTSSSFLRFESAFAHTRYLFSSHTLSEGWRSLSFKYFSLLRFLNTPRPEFVRILAFFKFSQL